MTLTDKLSYVAKSRAAAQEEVFAEALSTGVDALFREAVITDYLAGRCERDSAVDALGSDLVGQVDARRDAFEDDIEWALGA